MHKRICEFWNRLFGVPPSIVIVQDNSRKTEAEVKRMERTAARAQRAVDKLNRTIDERGLFDTSAAMYDAIAKHYGKQK